MEKKRVGFAVCGSFCTFSKMLIQMQKLKEMEYDLLPILSEAAYGTDTRFGKAEFFIREIEEICEKKILHTFVDAEPIGPQNLLDALIIAPCTGNTLGKLACGITDSSVTMAAKAHLRNAAPVLIAVSTNDALGASGTNISTLMNRKNIFFVPMKQDNPQQKPTSVVADFELIPKALEYALDGEQMQPVWLS